MRSINGRTWDVMKVVKIEGMDYNLYADTTWGKKFYLTYNTRWYSGDIYEIVGLRYKTEIEVKRG